MSISAHEMETGVVKRDALPGSDRILPITRVVAGLVTPVLVLAFLILFFAPGSSGQRFAWEIKPDLTAMFMGAGYLGGAWFFANVLFGRRWHRVGLGFPSVSVFTVTMLLATILHWARFDINRFPFQLWLALYIVTPLVVPALWLLNRRADPGTPEPGDLAVPGFVRRGYGLLGIGLLAVVVIGFLAPDLFIAVWPWKLTPLTARVVAGWGSLLGVAGVVSSRDSRWSAWRLGLQSIFIWQALTLVAAVLRPGDFTRGSLFNWYVGALAAALASIAGLYAAMKRR